MSRRLEEQTAVVNQGIVTVAEAIRAQAKTIEQALKSLGDGKTKLDEFLKGISDSHQEFLKHLNTYYDVGTITGVASQIKAHIENSQSQTARQISSEVRDLKKVVSTIEQTTSMQLGSQMLKYLPHALLTIAGVSVLILIVLIVLVVK